MKKASFLIDMDGVLVNSVGRLLKLHEQETGIHIDINQITCYNIEKATGINGLNKYWGRPEVYEGLDLTPDAKLFIKWLNQNNINYEVQSLSTNDLTSSLKAEILKRNGVKKFKFVDYRDKKDFSKFDYVIEDNPSVIHEDYNNLFLVEREYNKGLQEKHNFKYVRSLVDSTLIRILVAS